MVRVEIPVRKWISKSSPLVPATYQGCLQQYCEHFGQGPGVWGEGPVLDPLMGGKFEKLQPFSLCMNPRTDFCS